MSPQQKAANTRRWNRQVAKCSPNDREELEAFREFLSEPLDKNADRQAWFDKWGEYCGFTPAEIASALPPPQESQK